MKKLFHICGYCIEPVARKQVAIGIKKEHRELWIVMLPFVDLLIHLPLRSYSPREIGVILKKLDIQEAHAILREERRE